MTTDEPHAMKWVPSPADDLVIGPLRWTGTAVVTDVSHAYAERIITLGLIERMLLDMMDGERDVHELRAALTSDSIDVSTERLFQILNKFALYGIVQRPFTSVRGAVASDVTEGGDRAVLEDSAATRRFGDGLLNAWQHLGWLSRPVPYIMLLVLGLLGAAGLAFSVPDALAESTTNPSWAGLGLCTVVAVCWHLCVTLLHENAHAGTFHRISGRRPQLGVIGFGVIPLPNSRLSGLLLLSSWRRAQIIAAGPAVSAALALVPVAVWQLSEQGTWLNQLAALSVCLEAAVLALGVSFFPNTDGSRLLEAWALVDQIQQVAFRTLTGKNPLPAALPTHTRLLVRVYPILLALTFVVWVLAAVGAIRLVLT